MNKLTLILVGIVLVLLLVSGFVAKLYFDMKAEKNRIESNLNQVTNDNAILNVKNGELSNINTEMTAKYDSVLKANKIKENEVKYATIIKTVYRDTGSVKIMYKEPVKIKGELFAIPVSYDSGCWGFKGEIQSMDKYTKLNITEKTANNNVQALITRKRVLGFLWWNNKKEKLQVFSDCGEANVTQINYNRK